MAEILIVDDEGAMRRTIARMLTRRGHVAHEACNGKEGLEVFDRVDPALVITDIVMEGGEGIETIRALRTRSPELPILAISGGSNHALYLRSATRLGADAALAKPFTQSELLEVVTRLLNRLRAESES